MINHYETVFILTPVLSDIQMKETVRKFTSLLKDNNAVILNSEEWGLKKLAYPIAGKSTGFYVLVQFDAEASFVATLETEFRRDERIIRFLTTKLDKYALVYAEKRMKNRVSRINEAREESKKRYKERLVSSNSGENVIHNSENEEKQEHVSQILSKDEGEKQDQFIEKDNSQEENTSVNEN